MPHPLTKFYEFGPFCLDVSQRLLARDGTTVPLTPKVFDTLLHLVQHSGTALSKDELMRAIWPKTVVEENNLNQNISILRRVLERPRGRPQPAPLYRDCAGTRLSIRGGS